MRSLLKPAIGPKLAKAFWVTMAILAMSLVFSPKTSAQSPPPLLGNWSMTWVGASDTYVGVLRITKMIDKDRYSGRVTVIRSSGFPFTQDAEIKVNGKNVTIDCQKPADQPNYDADHYSVVLDGNKMTGNSKDDRGATGKSIVFTRL